MHWTKCNPKGVWQKTGGYDAQDEYNDLMVFDTDIQNWYKPHTTDGPGQLRAHTATAIGKKIFVFGGGDGPNYFNTVWSLDTKYYAWERFDTTGLTPSPRRSHSAELVDDKIYIFGGGDGRQALNDTYCLDVETAKWNKIVTRGVPPPKRGYHKSVLVGKNIYVLGGSDGQEAFSDIHMLDTATHTWTKSKAKGVGLLASSAVVMGNYISLFGGHSPSEYVNSFRSLDLRTIQWYTPGLTGTRPSPRAYHSMSLANHRMWVIGGYDTVNCFSDVHMLDLGSFTCQEYTI